MYCTFPSPKLSKNCEIDHGPLRKIATIFNCSTSSDKGWTNKLDQLWFQKLLDLATLSGGHLNYFQSHTRKCLSLSFWCLLQLNNCVARPTRPRPLFFCRNLSDLCPWLSCRPISSHVGSPLNSGPPQLLWPPLASSISASLNLATLAFSTELCWWGWHYLPIAPSSPWHMPILYTLRSGARFRRRDEGVVPCSGHGFSVATHKWLGRDMKIPDNIITAPADDDSYSASINVPQ